MKDELIKKRKELKDRLDAIQADYKAGLDPDSGERAVQLENRETLAEIERVTIEEINNINDQLRDLD